jgi:ribonuclease HI
MYTLHFDGLFQEIGSFTTPFKAGLLGYGWLALKDGTRIAHGYGVVARAKDATSGAAEYLALIEGLDALSTLSVGQEPVRVAGDAKFVIDQMRGMAAVTSPVMKPLYRRAMKLALRFSHIEWVWMPRRYNKSADALTRQAMMRIHWAEGDYQAALNAIRSQDERSTRLLPLVDLRIYQPAGGV